jgi:hypothetical protein
VVLIGLAVLVLAAVITAAAFAAKAQMLGKTNKTPKPNCPAADTPNPTLAQSCQVMGQVTGFQRSVDGKKTPFKIKKNGKIVAWSIDLSKPAKDERSVFQEFGGDNRYGDGPTAGIAVLKKKGDKKFKLKKKSPIVKVKGYLGQRPVFTLEDPLKVKAGDIIAVTTPTWLPNFSVKNLSANNVWVASRKPDECSAGDVETFFDQSSPHLKVGSERKYGCVYTRARLLYWAYFVPSKGGGGN